MPLASWAIGSFPSNGFGLVLIGSWASGTTCLERHSMSWFLPGQTPLWFRLGLGSALLLPPLNSGSGYVSLLYQNMRIYVLCLSLHVHFSQTKTPSCQGNPSGAGRQDFQFISSPEVQALVLPWDGIFNSLYCRSKPRYLGHFSYFAP